MRVGEGGGEGACGRLAAELPRDPETPRGLHVHHGLRQAERRLAIWGGDEPDSSDAVEFLISSGLLDRFLEVVWKDD